MGNYVFISIYILPLLSEVFIKSSECCEALQFLNHAVPPPPTPLLFSSCWHQYSAVQGAVVVHSMERLVLNWALGNFPKKLLHLLN